MIATCMYPLHQVTLLQPRVVLLSCLASVQFWMLMNKLKLNPDNTEFLLIGNEQQRSKYLSIFRIEIFGVKTNPATLHWNSGYFGQKIHLLLTCISSLQLMFLSYIRDLWRIHCFLDLDSAKFLITVIQFCLVMQTLTSPNFNVFRINWLMLQRSHQHLLAVFHLWVPFIGYQ